MRSNSKTKNSADQAMAFRFYTVPIQDSEEAGEELNAFLRSHRVLSVDRRWVDQGAASFWAFCVDYLENTGKGASSSRQQEYPEKVDYREVLSEEDFAVFASLRELRKEIAQSEAVPVYTIFTNKQLAEMVLSKVRTKAALGEIAGVGDSRIEKYGARVLALLQQQWEEDHEADGEPVRENP